MLTAQEAAKQAVTNAMPEVSVGRVVRAGMYTTTRDFDLMVIDLATTNQLQPADVHTEVRALLDLAALRGFGMFVP